MEPLFLFLVVIYALILVIVAMAGIGIAIAVSKLLNSLMKAEKKNKEFVGERKK